MSARKRREDESYEGYRHDLKVEAMLEKIKRGTKWVWRSFVPHPQEAGKIIKTPPYRKSKEESK